MIYLKCDNPANDQLIINEIHCHRGLENYKVQTMADLISLYTPSRFPGFRSGSQRGHLHRRHRWLPGDLPVHVYGRARTHPRDRHSQVAGLFEAHDLERVLRETAVLAVAGVLLGIAATYGVRGLLGVKFPTFAFELTAEWIGRGALIAFAGALLGALYPAWMAARKDPIDALAYE